MIDYVDFFFFISIVRLLIVKTTFEIEVIIRDWTTIEIDKAINNFKWAQNISYSTAGLITVIHIDEYYCGNNWRTITAD